MTDPVRAKLSDKPLSEPCAECTMLCKPNEYHPFAACLMFKACHDANIVRANLAPIVLERMKIAALEARLAAAEGVVERMRASRNADPALPQLTKGWASPLDVSGWADELSAILKGEGK